MTSNSTPKNANGTQSPAPAKESASKASKSKAKQNKAAKEAKEAKEAEVRQAEEDAAAAAAYKEPELTAEERKMRKEVC